MSECNAETRAEVRLQAQKERILAAAKPCFVQYGFHSASMATIAETAAMSPGLIYRYFENKSAIILAIIEQQLEVARRRIRELHASDDVAGAIVDDFDECRVGAENTISAALFLDMSAEATRDPQIGAALTRFDRTIRAELVEWLTKSREQGGHGMPVDVAVPRALMLVCLIEGVKVRAAREPDLDRTLLVAGLRAQIRPLAPPPEDDGER